MQRNLSLRLLEAFVAVAELRSYTAAADSLSLSQSAVSRSVQDIERLVGARLLERNSKHVALTLEGTEFLEIARGVLASADEGLLRFDRFKSGLSGAIVIATIPSTAATIVPECLTEYVEAYPDVTIRIVDGLAATGLDLVRRGQVDLAITACEPSQLSADFRFDPLRMDEMCAVVNKDHPWSGTTEVAWSDLQEQPLITLSSDSSVNSLVAMALATQKIQPQSNIEASSTVAAGALVAAGLGVCVLPELVLGLIAFADVVALPLRPPIIARQIGIATMKSARLSPAARRFCAIAKSHAAI